MKHNYAYWIYKKKLWICYKIYFQMKKRQQTIFFSAAIVKVADNYERIAKILARFSSVRYLWQSVVKNKSAKLLY